MGLPAHRNRYDRAMPRAVGTAPLLEFVAASRVYRQGREKVTALAPLHLQVTAGELVAVMGASGSGKSTLLSLAGGLDEPTTGRVLVDGTALSLLDATATALLRRRTIGFVFQELNLIPTLTAAENVGLPIELDGGSPAEARAAAEELLKSLGLGDLADRYPEALSGGQQQRVAIARALLGERRLVLADEPTGALDTATGDEVMRMLRAVADQGRAVVVATHNERHVRWADRVVSLADGAVVSDVRPEPDADLR